MSTTTHTATNSTKNKKNNIKSNLSSVVHRLETLVAGQIYKKYFAAIPDGPTKPAYMASIVPHRPGKLSQDETIQAEIDTIAKADECYEDDPELYPDKRTEYGYPDKFRCHFIYYRRHRFTRCCNVISKDDPDDLYCAKHSSQYCEYTKAYEEIKDRLEALRST